MNKYTFFTPIVWNNINLSKKKSLLRRPIIKFYKNVNKEVKNIFKQVRKYGDKSLFNLSILFDNVKISNIRIPDKLILQAKYKVPMLIKQALISSMKNIECFHIAQKLPKIELEILPGVYCKQIIKPISSVGLYIPGGITPLPSTVLMLAIPARIAGCKRIIICSPPPISDEIYYAAQLCNVDEIYQIGGAQAIAAMGFGTDSIIKVDKIFGPGNIWVTQAKKEMSQRLGHNTIDMLAGPSEVLIIADHEANPEFIAADLLAQAEHSAYSQVILLTPIIKVAKEVIKAIKKQIKILPRANLIKQTLENSRLIITTNLFECIKISNYYAPEHLIIQTYDAKKLVKHITNAGSIFLGHWSPEAAGDYATGTNHVLPTYGCTKTSSGLGVMDFQKRITVQQLSPIGLSTLAPTIKILAQTEKLTAHEYSISVRMNILKGKI